ncbi:hypothetical protein TNCV_1942551 [Trichonephila clavipes]|nr:hypothetical protein TNCV_1942551 [Trichonephila clavipes]
MGCIGGRGGKIRKSSEIWFDATKHPPSTHGSTCRNCGGGDRGCVAIYRPFGELRRAKIVLSPVWCSRPTTGVPLAHATMNFVGLDLTASDRIIFRTFANSSRCYRVANTRIVPPSEKGLMRVKSVNAQSSPIGMMKYFIERFQLRCLPRHWILVTANSLRIA